MSLAQSIGNPLHLTNLAFVAGEHASLTGDFALAMDWLRRSRDSACRYGLRRVATNALLWQGAVALWNGDIELARERLDSGLTESSACGEDYESEFGLLLQVQISLAEGNVTDAAARLDQVGRWFDKLPWHRTPPVLEVAAAVALASGEASFAARLLAAAGHFRASKELPLSCVEEREVRRTAEAVRMRVGPGAWAALAASAAGADSAALLSEIKQHQHSAGRSAA